MTEAHFYEGDLVWINKQMIQITSCEPDKQSFVLSCGTSIGLLDLQRTAILVQVGDKITGRQHDNLYKIDRIGYDIRLVFYSCPDKKLVGDFAVVSREYIMRYAYLVESVESKAKSACCFTCAKQATCERYRNTQIGENLPIACSDWQPREHPAIKEMRERLTDTPPAEELARRQREEGKRAERRFCACGQEIYANKFGLGGVPMCADCKQAMYDNRLDVLDNYSPLTDNQDVRRRPLIEKYKGGPTDKVQNKGINTERYPREGKSF